MEPKATATFQVKVNGAKLSDQVMPLLISAYVDDSLHLPDMFSLTFRDPDRNLLTAAGIKIGSTITIEVASDASPSPEKLIGEGEVTALEAEFEPSGTLTVVRGYDQSHRLFRGRQTESYKNASYSDIARKVAQRAGLGVGKIDSSTPIFDHVSQWNQTDWQFLTDLAREIGYEVAVVEKKLQFRKPVESSTAPGTGNLQSENPLSLVLGTNLLRFRSVVTAAEQVKEVSVRGWDFRTKKAVLGHAKAATTSATLGVKPDELASLFGNPVHVSVDTLYGTQKEADRAAASLSEEVASTFAAFEGVARGNPKLKAGTAVSLGLVGPPFDGRYTVTNTRHAYDPDDGYNTLFTVSGRQERSMLGLTSGGGSNGSRISGVVIGIVTDVNDPDKLCRVKVKFPWLSDNFESDWIRAMQASVGSGYGSMVMPEVNDEVLVAFHQGDVQRPYVLGGLYNGVDKPTSGHGGLVGSDGKVNHRAFNSRSGHVLSFVDQTGKESISLVTGNKKHSIKLDSAGSKITINSDGSMEISAKGDITIKATGNLSLSGRQVSIKATAGMELDGGSKLDLKASGPLSAEGATATVKGTGKAELSSSGVTSISGTLVKIN